MTGCPLAYTDPCGKCPRFGTCAPSQAVQKLDSLETQLKELLRLVDKQADEKKN